MKAPQRPGGGGPGRWPHWRARRRSVRLRLTLTYSGLFLLGGTALLAFIYVFVVRSLGPAGPLQVAASDTTFQQACRKALADPAAADPNLVHKCDQSFRQGVAAGEGTQRARVLHDLLLYSFVGLGAVGVVSGGAGWVMAGRALRPVHVITAAARRASEENLGERLALGGPRDELAELADTFDVMLERLDAAFASQRRFVANASHELRTPLTVMRTAIDVTLAKPARTPAQLEDMAAEVRQAVDRAEALISALLVLARRGRAWVCRSSARSRLPTTARWPPARCPPAAWKYQCSCRPARSARQGPRRTCPSGPSLRPKARGDPG